MGTMLTDLQDFNVKLNNLKNPTLDNNLDLINLIELNKRLLALLTVMSKRMEEIQRTWWPNNYIITHKYCVEKLLNNYPNKLTQEDTKFKINIFALAEVLADEIYKDHFNSIGYRYYKKIILETLLGLWGNVYLIIGAIVLAGPHAPLGVLLIPACILTIGMLYRAYQLHNEAVTFKSAVNSLCPFLDITPVNADEVNLETNRDNATEENIGKRPMIFNIHKMRHAFYYKDSETIPIANRVANLSHI